MLFHYAGSLGLSEAHAESIGSLLKRFSKRTSTARVVEATILRAHGVRGDGRDDLFLQLCWANFFGGLLPSRFSFERRGRKRKFTQKPPKTGRTLSRLELEAVRAARQFTNRDVRLALSAQGRDGPRRTSQWRTALGAVRQSEAG